jgi:hypothetical protein
MPLLPAGHCQPYFQMPAAIAAARLLIRLFQIERYAAELMLLMLLTLLMRCAGAERAYAR